MSLAFPRFLHKAVGVLIVALAALSSAPTVALAQVPATVETQAKETALDQVPTEDIQGLIETLEDEAQRNAFLANLKAAVATRDAEETAPPSTLGSQLLGGLSSALGEVGILFTRAAGTLDDLPKAITALQDLVATPDKRQDLLVGLLKAAIVVAAGLAAAGLGRALMVRPRRALEGRAAHAGLGERLVMLVGRLILDLIPPAMLAAAAWVVLPFLNAGERLSVGLAALIGAMASYNVILAFTKTILSPTRPDLRPMHMDDETAHYVVIWMRRLAGIAIFGYVAVEAAGLLGLPRGSYEVLLKLLGLLLAGLLVIVILQNRQPVAARLRKGVGKPLPGEGRRRAAQHLRARLADVWHVLGILWVGAAFVVWAADVEGGFAFMVRASVLTAAIVLLALGVGHALRLLMVRLFSIGSDRNERFPNLENRANRYVPVLHTVLRGFITLVAVLAVLQVWGIGVLEWLTAGPGQRLTGAVLTIGVVLIIAFIGWELITSWIERYLSTTDGDGNVVERSARAKTLLPLARNVLLVALVIIVGLIILSEIGVNIAPLLAGAGVIGLAIGFGSQKLVQDVITGAFMLFEDTIAVGDVVDVGGKAGVVEGLTIRTIKLRDLSGTVHSIPFSTVDKVSNLTKEFSFYLVDMGVAYREDTDYVFEVMTEVLEEMRQEEPFASDILEPLEVFGVNEFADSAVICRARIKTRPIKQWGVGREFNRRIKKRFDELGIEIPFPHTTLYFGVDKKGNAPPARVVMDERPSGGAPPPQETSDTGAAGGLPPQLPKPP